jgi:methyl-accepting chemotaxis protein
MGKWIITCENEKRNFTSAKEWSILKSNHELVHNKIQQYILENSQKMQNKILRQTASDIEDATLKVFDSLNDILYIESKNEQNRE